MSMHEAMDKMPDSYISVSDAANFLRKAVSKNERPYTKAVVLLNNDMVDDWKKDVLEKKAVNGQLQASMVWNLWRCYSEGIENLEFMDNIHMLVRMTPLQIQFWKTFFEQDIEKLHGHGIAIIGAGWSSVWNEVAAAMQEAKFEHIYSKSKHPLDWWDLMAKFETKKDGFNPFWQDKEVIKDLGEKVTTILKNRVVPQL